MSDWTLSGGVASVGVDPGEHVAERQDPGDVALDVA